MSKRSDQLTDLNRYVNARYAECQVRGGHLRSGVFVNRDLHGVNVNMMVCAHCEVPFTRRTVPKAAITINGRYRPKEAHDQLEPTDL